MNTTNSNASSSDIANVIETFSNAVFTTIPIGDTQVEAIVIWLAAPMLLLTFYFKFVNLRGLKQAFRILRGYDNDDTAPGEISQFQALSTAISGTVGLANIAGVAIAISLGGPGVVFWMAVIGLFAMSLKFAEVTLSVKYRSINPNNSVSGGPMYYLRNGLAARGWKKTGLALGWTYAILGLPAILQLGQVNQSYSQVSSVTGIDAPWLFGCLMAIATGLTIFGGLKNIAWVTARLVPIMAIIYLGAAAFILINQAQQLPSVFMLILSEAFNPQAATAGSILAVFVIGMRRAVYSTEAGIGSATIAHAAAKTREPISEGLVALLEPFIDTVVICTVTGLVIITTGVYQNPQLNDIQMTSTAFNSVIEGFDIVLTLAVVLFAFSTIISWAYYTSRIWGFVFGNGQISQTIFKTIYCLALIPAAAMSVNQVISVMDSIYFLMAIPNIIGIYIMSAEIKRDLNKYFIKHC